MDSLNSDYRSVKLEYGEKINRIKNFGQKDWMRICGKLGLFVAPAFGKGSHCAVYKTNTCLPADSDCFIVTIVHNPYPEIQRDITKKIIFYGLQSGKYSEKDFWRIAGIK